MSVNKRSLLTAQPGVTRLLLLLLLLLLPECYMQTAEVLGTLTGHKGQVNCVKWLPASGEPPPDVAVILGWAWCNICQSCHQYCRFK
jgi:hypothetical protein